MMQYKEYIKPALRDRPYFIMILAIMLIAVIGAMYVFLTVAPRDIQVATHYTSFGETNYYKGKWYSLYGYALLFLAIAAGHSMLMLKFQALDRRDFGMLFGAGTLVVLIIGIMYAVNIIQQIAFI